MKKNRYLIILLVLAAVGLSILWKRSLKTVTPSENYAGNRTRSATNPNPSSNPEQQGRQQPTPLRTPVNNSPPISAALREYVEKSMADPGYDWKQPINFYGKVLDENERPISGASIHFRWTDISEKGTSDADTTSDNNGFFSLTDRRGKRMSVTASKPGYYSAGDARLASFEYANPADGLFTPDANNPVIFHLRKKGVGADLITSQYGVKDSFGVTLPLDGTTIQVDLIERKTGSGQLAISQTKPDYKNWKQATEWSFGMELSGGGFVEYTNEFPFEAPETGYEPVVRFNFQAAQTNWTLNLNKDYYIKFGSPSRFGRLHLETSIMMGGVRLTYAINPDGSRNLEPK